jgi:cytochrome c553
VQDLDAVEADLGRLLDDFLDWIFDLLEMPVRVCADGEPDRRCGAGCVRRGRSGLAASASGPREPSFRASRLVSGMGRRIPQVRLVLRRASTNGHKWVMVCSPSMRYVAAGLQPRVQLGVTALCLVSALAVAVAQPGTTGKATPASSARCHGADGRGGEFAPDTPRAAAKSNAELARSSARASRRRKHAAVNAHDGRDVRGLIAFVRTFRETPRTRRPG